MQPEATRPFVGRERELAALEASVREAIAGRGGLALLSGEAGSGKSRLLTMLAERATAAGARVLWGRCWEQAGAPLYWPWVQVIRAGARGLSPAVSARLGDGAAKLATLAPEVAAALGVDAAGPSGEAPAGDAERFRLHDAVAAFLEELATAAPLILLFDDVHFADRPSLSLIEHGAREAMAHPILFVAAYRPEDARLEERQRDAISSLSRSGMRIPVPGLSVGEVRDLARGLGVDVAESTAHQLREATGGNPFFVTEVVNAATSETGSGGQELVVPGTVRDAVRTRLERLTPEAIDVLRNASALGRRFQLGVLASALERDAAELAGVLDLAIEAGVLVAAGSSFGSYAFVHAIMQESLYADIPQAEREGLHLAIAIALERFYGRGVDGHLGEIAYHLFESGDVGTLHALSYASRAGKHAADRFEWEAAVENYERAFTLLDRLGADRAARCAFLLEYGEALGHAGERDRATGRIREAIRLAYEVGDWDAMLRASFALANWRTAPAKRSGRGDQAESEARQLRRRVLAASDPDQLDERLALSLELVEAASKTSRADLLFDARKWLLITQLEAMDVTGFRDTLDAAMADARDGKLPPGSQMTLRAFKALVGGRLELAERLTIDAIVGGADHATLADEVLVGQMLALADRRGRFRELAALWESMVSIDPIPSWSPYLARLHAMAGNLDDARRLFDRAASSYDALPRDWSWLPNLDLLAEACWVLRDAEVAPRLRALLEPYGHRFLTFPLTFAAAGPVARAVALLYATEGDLAAAVEWMQRAVDASDLVGYRYGALVAASDLVGFLAASGDTGRAAALASSTRAEAADLGYTLIIETLDGLGPHAPADQVTTAHHMTTVRSGVPRGSFRRDGNVWVIRLGDGPEMRFSDGKGFACVHTLLAHPGQEFHALQLLDLAAGGPLRASGPREPASDGIGVDTGAGMPLLDGEAKAQLRRRIDDLREEVAEAREWGDDERVARAEEELDTLARALSASIGLGGRDRTSGGSAERARVNVTRLVKRAIDAIGETDPAAARYLTDTIKRGGFCSYNPDPARPVEWLLR